MWKVVPTMRTNTPTELALSLQGVHWLQFSSLSPVFKKPDLRFQFQQIQFFSVWKVDSCSDKVRFCPHSKAKLIFADQFFMYRLQKLRRHEYLLWLLFVVMQEDEPLSQSSAVFSGFFFLVFVFVSLAISFPVCWWKAMRCQHRVSQDGVLMGMCQFSSASGIFAWDQQV